MKTLLAPATARLLQKHGFPQPAFAEEGMWFYDENDEAVLVLDVEDNEMWCLFTGISRTALAFQSRCHGWVFIPSTEHFLQELNHCYTLCYSQVNFKYQVEEECRADPYTCSYHEVASEALAAAWFHKNDINP
jgi:hypothetical protein